MRCAGIGRAWQWRTGALVGALLVVLALASTSAASPGRPDVGFGHRGVLALKLSRDAEVERADLAGNARDGYVALASLADDRGVLIRVTPGGRLDRSFGDNGVVRLDGGPWNALALTGEGRILLAGSAGGIFAVQRLLPDGSPDPSFGSAGIALVPVAPTPPGTSAREYTDLRAEATDLALGADGSLVAAGNLSLHRGESLISAGTAVLRLTADGRRDPGFADDGALEATAASGERIKHLNRVVPQPDGKLLLAGNGGGGMRVARLLPDGRFDPGFAHGGILVTETDSFSFGEGFGQSGDARTVLVRPDRRLVVVGQTTLLGLRPDGRVDRSFGGKGVVDTGDPYSGFGPEAEDAALDDRGRILIAGENGGATAVARLLPDGTIDRRYGREGMGAVVLDRSSGENGEAATSLLVGPNGATLTAAFANGRRGHRLALVARNGGDGTLYRCNGVAAVVHGTPGPDVLRGWGPIVGLGGDDVIFSNGGSVCAGAGADVIRGAGGFISAGPGDDRVLDGAGTILGGLGDDLLEGGSRGDRIFGGAGSDRLRGRTGRDRLFGGPGDDTLWGEGAADRIFGGSGDDLLRGESGTDALHGGSGVNRTEDGADGPPNAVYAMRRPGFRVRLRVEGNLINGIHLGATTRCANGGRAAIELRQNEAHLRIKAGGRFRQASYSSTEYGTETTRLEGTVGRDRIVGTFMHHERESTTCRTGTREDPEIHFVARRLG